MLKKRRQPQLCPRLFSYPCAIKNATPRESARSEDAVPSKTSLTISPGGSEPAKKIKSREFPLCTLGICSSSARWIAACCLQSSAKLRGQVPVLATDDGPLYAGCNLQAKTNIQSVNRSSQNAKHYATYSRRSIPE